MSSPPNAKTLFAALVVALAFVACREGRPVAREVAGSLATPVRVTPGCAGDSLRPSTAAPAEGLWLTEGASERSVAVMVGPARAAAGDTRVVRRVETVEVVAVGDTLRRVADETTVRLELVPLLPGEALGDADGSASAVADVPAAAYVIGPTIMVTAYEPCATSARVPRLRYLRRDARGRPVTDVLLQRASGG
ncbi:MAG TPA: hypothetical protein VM076_09025 [Gemmatimonadaceae bacterium]|nr:hypothetical protein [Gemmatimonadaceae bacterium]